MIAAWYRWKVRRLTPKIEALKNGPVTPQNKRKLDQLGMQRALAEIELSPLRAALRMRWVLWVLAVFSLVFAAGIASVWQNRRMVSAMLAPAVWLLPVVAWLCVLFQELEIMALRRPVEPARRTQMMLEFEAAAKASPQRATYRFDVDDSGDAGIGERPWYTDAFTEASFRGWALHAQAQTTKGPADPAKGQPG